jgi:hypothetical protein
MLTEGSRELFGTTGHLESFFDAQAGRSEGCQVVAPFSFSRNRRLTRRRAREPGGRRSLAFRCVARTGLFFLLGGGQSLEDAAHSAVRGGGDSGRLAGRGMWVMVELGFVQQRWWADCRRAAHHGRPGGRHAHRLVRVD